MKKMYWTYLFYPPYDSRGEGDSGQPRFLGCSAPRNDRREDMGNVLIRNPFFFCYLAYAATLLFACFWEHLCRPAANLNEQRRPPEEAVPAEPGSELKKRREHRDVTP
jgi:hypothetical protein